MAKEETKRRERYIIPNNFVNEGRILNGMFRTRYFFEGLGLALLALIFAFLIPTQKFTTRITLIVLICGPFFALGIVGIGGDPVSVAVKNVFHWFQTKSIMLYDSKPRVLAEAPLDKMMNQPVPRDQIISYIEKIRQQHMDSRTQQELIEDETFRFAADRDFARKYIDPDKFGHKNFEFELIDNPFDEDIEFEIDDIHSIDIPSIHSSAPTEWDNTSFDFLETATITIDRSPQADTDHQEEKQNG